MHPLKEDLQQDVEKMERRKKRKKECKKRKPRRQSWTEEDRLLLEKGSEEFKKKFPRGIEKTGEELESEEEVQHKIWRN